MRHLIVPSVDTQHWLNRIKANDWMEPSYSILSLDDDKKAIPLSAQAPKNTDDIWQGLEFVELNRRKAAKRWTDLLEAELYQRFEEFWPKSYEIIGDILIVKLEDEVVLHQREIAQAMLEKHPSIRLICADKGVHGEFRVRNLTPIDSRDGDTSTLTRIREGGKVILIDPTKSYYSARLSNERLGNLISAKKLAKTLDRPISVCDPYAGVGPAMASIISSPNLVDYALIGDLNPDAVSLLEQNITNFTRKVDTKMVIKLLCQDARLWKNTHDYLAKIDLLLVNLPHDTVNHIPELLPLMRKNSRSLIRGWAIINRDEVAEIRDTIERQLKQHGATEIDLQCTEVKGYSTSRIFVRIESWQTFN